MNDPKGYYNLLGITESNLSDEGIYQRYKTLVKQCHPDKYPDKKEDYISLNNAFDAIKTADLREEYQSPMADQFDPTSGFGSVADFFNFNFNSKPGDQPVKVTLTLDELMKGTYKKAKVSTPIRCDICQDRQYIREKCRACNGSRLTKDKRYYCSECQGEGSQTFRCTKKHTSIDIKEFNIEPNSWLNKRITKTGSTIILNVKLSGKVNKGTYTITQDENGINLNLQLVITLKQIRQSKLTVTWADKVLLITKPSKYIVGTPIFLGNKGFFLSSTARSGLYVTFLLTDYDF